MLSNKYFQTSVKIFLHLLFWAVVYFGYTYFLGYGSSETKYVNLFSGFLMPITMAISYFLVYYLIPKYLLQKKYKLFILYSVYTLILSVYLIILSILYGLTFLVNLKPENTSPLTKTLPFIIIGVFFVSIIAVALSLVKYNYKSLLVNEDLKNKFLETKLQLTAQELQFLKMQIHPHFLFNSLNTIYGFALTKRDEAPEMILKLSNLLDYILYQIKKPSVFLSDEIKHLKDYVDLEKMRFQDSLQVNFLIDISDENKQIAPMLFIPFVENSFKHGAQINGILKVDIKLFSDENWLTFEVINTFNKAKNIENGIGLENSKKRLELLYPENYDLIINQTENLFSINLKLDVNGLNLG